MFVSARLGTSLASHRWGAGILWNVRPVILGIWRAEAEAPLAPLVLLSTRQEFQNLEVLEGKTQNLRNVQIHVKNQAILFPFSIKK